MMNDECKLYEFSLHTIRELHTNRELRITNHESRIVYIRHSTQVANRNADAITNVDGLLCVTNREYAHSVASPFWMARSVASSCALGARHYGCGQICIL